MKDYQLICFSDDSCLELRCFDNDICFDTPVQIFLCYANNRYILLDDILGYALSELKSHFCNMDSLELIPELLKTEIGIAQNEYYYRCAEKLPLDAPAIKEINEKWCGNKYSCFESQDFSTWVYRLRGQSYLKVTPLYSGNYNDEPKISYKEFSDSYKVLYENCLQKKEVLQCQTIIKKLEKLIN